MQTTLQKEDFSKISSPSIITTENIVTDETNDSDELLNMDTKKAEEKVDWSQFKTGWKEKMEPEIYLKHECRESVFSSFRQLSYKIAGCSYDIPLGHRVIFAYARMQGSSDPERAVGAITYWVASKDSNPNASDFMDDSFHKVSFLFVDKCYRKKGIGRRLVNAAIESIRTSTVNRAIHLESAKSAIKFFRKMGFVSCSKLTKSVSQRHSIFNNCVNMHYKL